MSNRTGSWRFGRRGMPALLAAMMITGCVGAPARSAAYPAKPDSSRWATSYAISDHTDSRAHDEHRAPAVSIADTDNALVWQASRGRGMSGATGLFATPDDRSMQANGGGPAASPLRIPPAASPDAVLLVRVETRQPYIDQAATRVTYDGMDKVFIIDWRADGKSGQVRVPERLFTARRDIADVLEDARAGVAVPALYTPVMVQRLWPYMRDARDTWAREFDEMAYASTGMLATATILTLRPLTAPVVAPALRATQTRPILTQTRPPGAVGMIRVGRWMSEAEHAAMKQTGMVQVWYKRVPVALPMWLAQPHRNRSCVKQSLAAST